MKVSIKDWGKGLNADALPSELEPGFCSAASNVRFCNGFAERVGGVNSGSTTVTSVWTAQYRSDQPRIVHSSSQLYYFLYGSISKIYSNNGSSTGIELTRLVEGVTISTMTRVGTTATVTTATAHGLATGAYVRTWGATPTQYNGTYSITVTGATTFTYTMASDPGASASPVALYAVMGNTAGAAISSITRSGTTATMTTSTAHGRSVGDLFTVSGATPAGYNGTYFVNTTPSTTTLTYIMAADPGSSASPVGSYVYHTNYSNFTNSLSTTDGRPQRYSGDSLNGIMLVNSPADGLYYWNGDEGTKLQKVPGSYTALVTRPFKNYVVQLGITVSGTLNPRRLAWSNATEPGSIPTTFTALDTNDAGNQEIAETGGEFIDCLPLGDVNILYKDDSRYAMQYIGGNEVFRFTKLPGSDGLAFRGCVIDTPAGHVFLSKNAQVMLHTGGECRDISTGRVGSILTGLTLTKCFLIANTKDSEAWIFIQSPSDPAGSPLRALIWNWKDDTWGIKDFPTGIGYGCNTIDGMLLTTTLKYGYYSRTLVTDFGTSYTSYIERQGIDAGDADAIKNLQRSRWNIDGVSGDAFSVSHGSAMTADAAPTYASAATYTLGTTDYVNSRATGGRFLAVKLSWTSASTTTPGRVRSCDLDVTVAGKR